MIKKYLLAPGPTPVPPEVLLAMAQPIIHHRTPQFEAIFAEAQEGLQRLFDTKSDVLILASSGTGAMEAAVINTTSPGDRVLVVNGGKFGERWGRSRRRTASPSTRSRSSGVTPSIPRPSTARSARTPTPSSS